MLDHTLQVITQAPYPEDHSNLPNRLYVLSTHTELNQGSHNVAVVICNRTSCAICMPDGCQIGWVITANAIPDSHASPGLMRTLDEEESTPMPGLTTAECQEKMMETLEKDGGLDALKDWPPELVTRARRLLMEYYSVFSLEPNEMGCMDMTEHMIEVTNSEPFRKRFRQIASLMVEEVRQHIQEMLDLGAIHPSQSPWCNAVVLIHKKDGSL